MFYFFHSKLSRLILLFASLFFPLLVNSQVNLDNGLVAYYPFNANANDESGNQNNGVVYGATPTTDRFNLPASAYFFEQNYIEVPDAPMLRGGALSISIWLVPSNISTIQMMIGKINRPTGTGEQYALALDPSDGKIRFAVKHNSQCSRGYGWQQIRTDSTVSGEKWTHVVATFEDGIHRIYRNGNLVLETLLVQSTIDYCVGGGIQIGAWHQQRPEYYSGKLDDIRIYNRAITPQEVQALYSGTSLTSAETKLMDNLSLFPNPAHGFFTVRSPEVVIQSLLLYDLSGRNLPIEINNNGNEVQVNSNFKGMAVVKVKTAQGIWVRNVRLE